MHADLPSIARATTRWRPSLLFNQRQRHRRLLRGSCAPVELICTLAILRADFHGQRVGFVRPGPLVGSAFRNIANLNLVVSVRVLRKAPRLALRAVWVATVIVVADAIAPLRNVALLVSDAGEFRRRGPWVHGGPLLASATADRGGYEPTVAPSVCSARLRQRIFLHVASKLKGRQVRGIACSRCIIDCISRCNDTASRAQGSPVRHDCRGDACGEGTESHRRYVGCCLGDV